MNKSMQQADQNIETKLKKTLKQWWQQRAYLGDAKAVNNHTDFLPAALEIQQTPPNRVAVYTGRLLILLFIIAVFWAYFGKVNIVAVTQGKIIPSSRIKHIQPIEKGIVRALFVKEGQLVKQGEKLVELDNTITQAEITRLKQSLLEANLNLLRLKQLMVLLEDKTKSTTLVAPYSDQSNGDHIDEQQELAQQNQTLEKQWQQYQSQQKSIALNTHAKKAELERVKAQVTKLQQTLPIINQRAQNYQNLWHKNMVAEEAYLAIEQQRIEQQQDLIATQAQQKQLQAEVNEAQERLQNLKLESLSQTLQQINQRSSQQKNLQQELAKAQDINAKQILYAPVTGTVQELKANTIGGVVTEAQTLMTIVPSEQSLEVQAFLENKDIGFVKPDMPAEIKIHTFPFTQYGVIDATVRTVTADALANQEKGLLFAVYFSMHRNTINVNGQNILLQPGMQVTAEVTTGQRRILEYIMLPVLKGFKESIRER